MKMKIKIIPMKKPAAAAAGSMTVRQMRNEIFVKPKSNIGDIDSVNLEHIFGIFGLTQNEKMLIIAASGRARSTTELAKQLDLPRATVHDAAVRLQRRRLLTRQSDHIRKIPTWRSDLRHSIGILSNIPTWPVPEDVV